jgi:hypothetical protein
MLTNETHHPHCNGQHDTAGNCLINPGVDAFGRCLHCGKPSQSSAECLCHVVWQQGNTTIYTPLIVSGYDG